ncbi:unnamed protein product, partial [Didymodactylos carnosus]
MERSMLNIRKIDKIRNENIRKQTKIIDITRTIKRNKWRWAGHVARQQDNRWTKLTTEWQIMDGKRKRGRQTTRWRDEIHSFLGNDWSTVAQNRGKWKTTEETFTACSFLIENVFMRRAFCINFLHCSVKGDNKTMYKAVTLIILVIIGATYASRSFNIQPKKLQRLSSSFGQPKVGLDVCPECIEESVEMINILLNLILDEGIIESCNALCGALANITGSVIIGEFCTVVCDAAGIDEFIKIIIKVDLDPIWYCEIIDLCPINDHGDAKFTNFGVTPKSAPDGSKFVIDCSFISINGTGTGTINIEIVDPKNRSSGDLFWFEARKPGIYPEKIGLQTLFEFDCDPSK